MELSKSWQATVEGRRPEDTALTIYIIADASKNLATWTDILTDLIPQLCIGT